MQISCMNIIHEMKVRPPQTRQVVIGKNKSDFFDNFLVDDNKKIINNRTLHV